MTSPSATSVMGTTTTSVTSPAATTTGTGSGGGGGPTSSPLLFFVALGFGVVFTNLWYAHPPGNSDDKLSTSTVAQLTLNQGLLLVSSTALGIIRGIAAYNKMRMASQ